MLAIFAVSNYRSLQKVIVRGFQDVTDSSFYCDEGFLILAGEGERVAAEL